MQHDTLNSMNCTCSPKISSAFQVQNADLFMLFTLSAVRDIKCMKYFPDESTNQSDKHATNRHKYAGIPEAILE